MSARSRLFFVLLLGLTTTGFGAEPQRFPLPQALPRPVIGQTDQPSALNHLRAAAEQLQAAGMVEEAAKLRELSGQIDQKIHKERDELTRQISELQQRADQLRLLTGTPEKILCRCCFLELSNAAAAQFAANAEPVNTATENKNGDAPLITVYQKGEEAIEKLIKSGQVTVLASPSIITTPGKAATSQVGGKFPIVVPAAGGQTDIEWKPFGVSCRVVPHLLNSGKIRLEFNPEISQRNFKNAVKFNGQLIPGLTTRRVQTQAELNLGETLAVKLVSTTPKHGQEAFQAYLNNVTRWVNGEPAPAAPQKTVTLFLVTPVAVD